MGAMAATLGHELNQPLTAVANYIGASQRMLQSRDISSVPEALGAALQATQRAAQIIRSVRQFVTLGEVEKGRISLGDVIREAGSLAAAVGCSGVELSYSLSGDDAVAGDAIQVQQVLLNLIRNGCEAAADPSSRHVTISSEVSGDTVKVSVEDNGPGIPSDRLATLFEAFRSTKDGGMGMGLAICRTIVEAHGGSIWAENRPEGGARLSFTLPLAAVPSGGELLLAPNSTAASAAD
jgi:two-component system sensor kinase FixL